MNTSSMFYTYAQLLRSKKDLCIYFEFVFLNTELQMKLAVHFA